MWQWHGAALAQAAILAGKGMDYGAWHELVGSLSPEIPPFMVESYVIQNHSIPMVPIQWDEGEEQRGCFTLSLGLVLNPCHVANDYFRTFNKYHLSEGSTEGWPCSDRWAEAGIQLPGLGLHTSPPVYLEQVWVLPWWYWLPHLRLVACACKWL